MIHIRVRPDDIPAEWIERASKLTAKLWACTDDGEDVPADERMTAREKRRTLIDSNENIWKDLKNILMGWSNGKCWYSELRDVGSDYHVDHFRPKGRVKNPGEAEREGYWWLAFDWKNYRIAVSWVNSPHRVGDSPAKGKHDQFPLGVNCTPATCEVELINEKPALLDPTNRFDVLLIDFDETGLPQPVESGWNAERVLTTRNVLHLDAPRMVEARQEVWRNCRHALLQAHSAMSLQSQEHRQRDDVNATIWIQKVLEMMQPEAPLSSVAQACVIKSEFSWARKLIAHVATGFPDAA